MNCPRCWLPDQEENAVCSRCNLDIPPPSLKWWGEFLVNPLLVFAPNSYGDTFERVRHLSTLDEQGIAWNLVVLDNLVSFFRKNFPPAQIFGYSQVLPPYDYWTDLLMGLARVNNQPTLPPYKSFVTDPDSLAKWKNLPHPSIVIISGAGEKYDAVKSRSLSAAVIDKIVSSFPKANWISYPSSESWEGTVGLFHNTDAVITVDTAGAYLAASIGKPTIVLFGASTTETLYYPNFKRMYPEAPIVEFTPLYDNQGVEKYSHDYLIEWMQKDSFLKFIGC